MDEIYLICGLGILTWFIGLMRGSGLDKYLLAGYNTASEKERAEMDKPAFIRYFKKFHLILGSVVILLGAGIYEFIGADYGLIVSVISMLVGYIIFFMNARLYGYAGTSLSPNWAVWIMLAVTVGVTCLFFLGMASNELTLSSEGISIDGMYGEEIAIADIESVCIVDEFPQPRRKSNGFSLSKTKKGWFINSKGQNVKLIIDDIDSPMLHIRTINGLDVYYQNDDIDAWELYTQINARWPDISCRN
jgi:hypothetical protein